LVVGSGATLGHKSPAITGERLMHISTLQPAVWLLRAAFIDRLALSIFISWVRPLGFWLIWSQQSDGVSLLPARSLVHHPARNLAASARSVI
jgi:hypothetical protein